VDAVDADHHHVRRGGAEEFGELVLADGDVRVQRLRVRDGADREGELGDVGAQGDLVTDLPAVLEGGARVQGGLAVGQGGEVAVEGLDLQGGAEGRRRRPDDRGGGRVQARTAQLDGR